MGKGVVMMRSRGYGDEIRASTYQYHPRHLLFRTDSGWHAGSLASVHRRMLELAPPEVRDGLMAIWGGQARQEEASGSGKAEACSRCGVRSKRGCPASGHRPSGMAFARLYFLVGAGACAIFRHSQAG